nr:hypothetical protein CFP56_33762 [Quercus suber]
MEFVGQHTHVPVPKVHMAFEHMNRVYIVMERLRGTSLSRGWHTRSAKSKAEILRQLKMMVEEWRTLSSPEKQGVANVDGGPIFDPRLPKESFWGPFSSIHKFHQSLRNGVGDEHMVGQPLPGLHELISFHNQPWPALVFTHGDLSSLNILCKDDEVVGIVDWETAGWFPAYWEYVTAWNVNPRNQFWQQEVENFLSPWPLALEMEGIRRKYFGDF